ncbi:hematopoietic SH2 domain-containing protein homolog isoform 2-T2 [Spinachia spinachia]
MFVREAARGKVSTVCDGGLNELRPGTMEHSQVSQGGQHDAVAWFMESQLPFVIRNGIVPEWFHGLISRKEAEELLMSKPPGSFLIRVGESRIGYSLSYRAEDCCRHSMIDASADGRYNIVGESRRHRCLQDMVDFHRRTPVSAFGEVLTAPSGQRTENKADSAELLFPLKSCLPNNSPHPSLCPPSSQEEIPTEWLPDRLCPPLEEEIPRHAFPLPAQPVSRMSCAADDPPSDRPPRLPARTPLPLLNRDASAPRNPLGGNAPPAKDQEAMASVVSNLKNLKKKFLKKKSTLQEYGELTARAGAAAKETPDAQAPHGSTNVKRTEGELPREYLPPPPFAPGF